MTPAQEPAQPRIQDEVVDRVQWEALRRAEHLGQLQPEGDQLLQQIRARHPEWAEEVL